MNYCENCGTRIDCQDEFCTECGLKYEKQQEGYINKFCDKCGTEIEKGDSFCTQCGENNCVGKDFSIKNSSYKVSNGSFALPSCELSEGTIIANKPVQTDDLNETRKSRKSITAIVLAAVAVMLIVSLGLMTHFYFYNKKSTNNGTPTTSNGEPTESKSDFNTTTEESTTELSKSTLYASDYLGYWHINMSNEKELTVHNIEGSQVKFSLWYYRLASLENVVATVNGNVASFSVNNNEGAIKGLLIFNEFSITVSITESELTYAPVETMTFDSRHTQSWEYHGFETSEFAVNNQGSYLTGKVSLSDPSSYLNVRSGPGTDITILKDKDGREVHLRSGQSVSILGEYDGNDNGTKKWYKITFAYGDTALTGYVHSDYIINEDKFSARGYITNRPRLGITYIPISQSEIFSIIGQSNDLPSGSIIIREIERESDLNNKDVHINDLIIAADGEKLTLTNTLEKIIGSLDVGDTITLTICRINVDYTINLDFDIKVRLI